MHTMTRNERTHARNQMDYTTRRSSCEWEPAERVHWYDKGYGTAQVSYASSTVAELQYAIDHYRPKSLWECGSYEKGLYHGCIDTLNIRYGIITPE